MSNTKPVIHPVIPWVSVDIPPSPESVVLIARKSGYMVCMWEYMTAQYNPEFRPKNPWITVAGDAITDSGHPPLFWRSPPASPTGSPAEIAMDALNPPLDPSGTPGCNLDW